MNTFLIRNDDVSFDTSIEEIRTFCEICDRYNHKILHAIVPIGEAQKVKSRRMTNEYIRNVSNKLFSENRKVIQFLLERNDLIGVHGLWHTHKPSIEEISYAKYILEGLGFKPTYFIPPFNEGSYEEKVAGLTYCSLSAEKGERLEDYLTFGQPKAPIMYLHSWRFHNKWYTFKDLENTFKRVQGDSVKLNLGSKYRRLEGFHNLDKLFGWTFQQGLPLYDNNSVEGITISHALMFLTIPELENIIDEMYRVLKPGGVVRITEDDTENPQSAWYKTGNVRSGPHCLLGPEILRTLLTKKGFHVENVDRKTTFFIDESLMQAYRGGQPNVFFLEGIKK